MKKNSEKQDLKGLLKSSGRGHSGCQLRHFGYYRQATAGHEIEIHLLRGNKKLEESKGETDKEIETSIVFPKQHTKVSKERQRFTD